MGVSIWCCVDPPYGIVQCKWDSILDLEFMWEQLKRVTKINGAIIMTAAQPFTSKLIMSNPKEFKYCWYWNKVLPRGHLNAKKQPLRVIEEVVVFYRKPCTYLPIKLQVINEKLHILNTIRKVMVLKYMVRRYVILCMTLRNVILMDY